MPYIITTRHPHRTVWEGPRSRVVTEAPPTRTAVATLEEAREAAHSAIPAPTCGDYHGAIYSLPESGGTIGPLPDGTVIEVQRVSRTTLRTMSGIDELPNVPGSRPDGDIIAAFNGAR